MTLSTQPSAAMVIGECMRMLEGRADAYVHHVAQEWLVANGYCYRVGFRDSALTPKGEAFATALIRKSGIVAVLDEEFEI